MKQAEFLNLETKQIQVLDASLEHPYLVRVPDGASGFYRWKDKEDNTFFLKKTKDVLLYSNHESKWEWCHYGFEMFGHEVVLWQRNPLRQKVDEAKQKLGMNERQLSKAIGREESYITKLFQDKRNPKPKTVETLITDLDRLMKPKPKPKDVLKTITVQLSIDTKEVQDELKKAYGLVDQSNQNTEMYRHKCEAQANLIKWMGGLIALLLILGIAMVAL